MGDPGEALVSSERAGGSVFSPLFFSLYKSISVAFFPKINKYFLKHYLKIQPDYVLTVNVNHGFFFFRKAFTIPNFQYFTQIFILCFHISAYIYYCL